MDEKEKKILDRTARLAEENNEILRKLHRAEKWRRFLSIMYWLIIIAISLGAYYFIQPYVDELKNVFNDIKEKAGVVGSALPLGDGEQDIGVSN